MLVRFDCRFDSFCHARFARSARADEDLSPWPHDGRMAPARTVFEGGSDAKESNHMTWCNRPGISGLRGGAHVHIASRDGSWKASPMERRGRNPRSLTIHLLVHCWCAKLIISPPCYSPRSDWTRFESFSLCRNSANLQIPNTLEHIVLKFCVRVIASRTFSLPLPPVNCTY